MGFEQFVQHQSQARPDKRAVLVTHILHSVGVADPSVSLAESLRIAALTDRFAFVCHEDDVRRTLQQCNS
jgi:hypothetical protein